MTRVLIGTCSWTDPTLLRSGWYPPEVKTPAARLQFYASRFSLVEVDATYYALPSPETVKLWTERTPADFTFDIKAFGLFTGHPVDVKALPQGLRSSLGEGKVYLRDLPSAVSDALWAAFREALLPLDSAGKLGAVLFQFPPWFLPGPASQEHILACWEKLGQYRMAVEFRNSAWLSERNREATLAFLREQGLVYVAVDEPQGFRSSVPSVAEATASLAIVRFHGRNREMWEKKGIPVVERFRYLYSQAELEEWLPRLQHLAAQAREVHLLCNNCYGDYGVRNAQDLARMAAALTPAE